MTSLTENYFATKQPLMSWLGALDTGMSEVRGELDLAYFLETALQKALKGPTGCVAYAGTDAIKANLERAGAALKHQIWAIAAVIPGGASQESMVSQEAVAGKFCSAVQASYGRIQIPGCGRAVLLKGPVIQRHKGGSLVVYFFIGLPVVVGG